MQSTNKQSGYIALTSAIIIAFILITITVIVSLSGFLGRFNILNKEFKEKSEKLAEACIEIAIVNLAQDIENTGEFPIGTNKCFIDSIGPGSGSNKIVKTHAIYNDSYTNLEAEINGSYNIVSWQECPGPC